MTNYAQRLAEATKEELLQVVQTIMDANATTRQQVLSIIDYLEDQKAANYSIKRRSSCHTTRASSEASQDSAVQLHPLLREALQNAEHDIKICSKCSKAFGEKDNTQDSCRHHNGHWLVEVETSDSIEFVRESAASEDILKSADTWVMSCCSASKDDFGEGCVSAKHVAMTAEDADGAARN